MRGYRIEYMGYRLNKNRVNLRKKHFIFISPQNEIVRIDSLRQFCKKHGLHYKTMTSIHNGHGNSCRGWRKFFENGEIRRHKGKNFIIINPQGKETIENNFVRFCKENLLSYDTLRKGFYHKGWKFKEYLK